MAERNSTPTLRQLSLRRALWQARKVARSLQEKVTMQLAEREATAALRARVREGLQQAPLHSERGCTVFTVAGAWQADVLRRDPDVFCADSDVALVQALGAPDLPHVMATRESGIGLERLRALCPHSKAVTGKTVFVEL